MQLFIKHTNIGLWYFMLVLSMNIQPSIVVSIRIHSANPFYIHSFIRSSFRWVRMDSIGFHWSEVRAKWNGPPWVRWGQLMFTMLNEKFASYSNKWGKSAYFYIIEGFLFFEILRFLIHRLSWKCENNGRAKYSQGSGKKSTKTSNNWIIYEHVNGQMNI